MRYKPIQNTAAVIAMIGMLSACGGAEVVSASAGGTALAPSAHAPTTTVQPTRETEWLIILINGKKSGYVQSTRTVEKETVVTEVTTAMSMQRAGTVNEITSVSTMTETIDGTPVRIEKHTRGVGMDQTVTGTIGPNGRLRLTTEAAGQMSSREVDWPKGALLNEGQRIEAMRYGLEKGVTYTSIYFDPDLLEAVPVTVEIGDTATVDLLGRVVAATEVTLTMNVRGTRIPLTLYVDDHMNTLKTVTKRMGMTVEMVACTEQIAKRRDDPVEVIRETFIKAPVALSKKRRMAPLTYTLHRISDEGPLNLISTDEQQVTPKGENLLVTVTPGASVDKKPSETGDAASLAEALASSRWIQSDADPIKQLADTARGTATEPLAVAKRIEAFVANYIHTKTLEVGYASALEVAKSRQGDCTEHALLTAALCRAAGIPAEVVFGLVYVDEFDGMQHLFGGHAWTRVYVKGRWVSLDAAMGRFDAGHIALAISRSGDPADFFLMIDVIGDIEMVSVD